MDSCNTCKHQLGGTPKCKLGTGEFNRTVQVSPLSGYNLAQLHAERPSFLDQTPDKTYKYMVIGYAPYWEDDRRGLIFSGQQGVKLVDYLRRSGLNIEDGYFSSILRCAAPKKRVPSASERNACLPYLFEEIKAIQPKVIILLGAKVVEYFGLNRQGPLNAIHGQVFDYTFKDFDFSTKLIPTFDPIAFVMHPDVSKERRCVDDYREVLRLLGGQPQKELHYTPNYRVIQNMDEVEWLVRTLNAQSFFYFDTESAALNPRKMPMLCFSFCWEYPGQPVVLPLYTHRPDYIDDPSKQFKIAPVWSSTELAEIFRLLAQPFNNPNISKGAHNFQYDWGVVNVHSNGVINPAGLFYDTMLMHHTLDEQRPHDLEALIDIEFGYGDYSATKRAITGSGKVLKRTYDYVPDGLLHPYAATDAEGGYRLAKLYEERLQAKANLWQLYCEEVAPSIEVMAGLYHNGIKLNLPILNKIRALCEQERDQAYAAILERTNPEFNPLSPNQIKDLVIQMGHKDFVLDDNKASGYCTDKKVIVELTELDPWFENFSIYRNRRKLLKTYLSNAENDLDTDGRLRYSYLGHGTETGRWSVGFIHQIPKINKNDLALGKPVMRDLIMAEPGWSIVYGDFSQVELWILAIHSKDEEMLRVLKTSDIHLASAAEVLGIAEDGIGTVWSGSKSHRATAKDNRGLIGKPFNFGLAYGSSGYNIVQTGQWVDIDGVKHNLTWDMLERGMDRWLSRFQGVKLYRETIGDVGRASNGVILSPFGRERRFGRRFNSEKQYERAKAEREAINFPIQSAASSLTNRTMIRILHLIKTTPGASDVIKLIMTIHDSITFEVKDKYVDWFKQVFRNVATRPIPALDDNTFKVNIGVGTTWTEAELNASEN